MIGLGVVHGDQQVGGRGRSKTVNGGQAESQDRARSRRPTLDEISPLHDLGIAPFTRVELAGAPRARRHSRDTSRSGARDVGRRRRCRPAAQSRRAHSSSAAGRRRIPIHPSARPRRTMPRPHLPGPVHLRGHLAGEQQYVRTPTRRPAARSAASRNARNGGRGVAARQRQQCATQRGRTGRPGCARGAPAWRPLGRVAAITRIGTGRRGTRARALRQIAAVQRDPAVQCERLDARVVRQALNRRGRAGLDESTLGRAWRQAPSDRPLPNRFPAPPRRRAVGRVELTVPDQHADQRRGREPLRVRRRRVVIGHSLRAQCARPARLRPAGTTGRLLLGPARLSAPGTARRTG